MESYKNMENYRDLASRTECDYNFEVLQRNSNHIRLLHAVLGLAGELSEFREALESNDTTNLLEELGDFFWYLAIIENILNLEFGENDNTLLTEGSSTDLLNDLEYYICSMVDSLKRQIFYGALGKDWIYLGYQTFIILRTLCKMFNSSVEEVKTKNIAKLKARYGDKFSEDRAINRDLANEKEVLNNA